MRAHSRILTTVVAGLLTLAVATEHAWGGRLAGNNGLFQTGAVDHTATRLDSEVFGWSTDFSQVGAIVAHTRRGPLGGARGEILLVVFPVDDIKPVESVEINIIVAADLPDAPVMLQEVFVDDKSQLADLDYNIARMWPMRPKKHRPDGWMKVDVLWDPVRLSSTECQPAVAFMLEAGGEVRFQPHQAAPDIRANCEHLRLSHTRTYWGRPDLAVAMARFDWSPDNHEISFRQPVSAKWDRARELKILLRATGPKDARTVQTARNLGRYGRVRVERAARGSPGAIATVGDLKLLEQRLAEELSLTRSSVPPQAGADIVVTLGDDSPGRLSKR